MTATLKAFTALVLSMSLGACSAVKSVDEMKDATHDLRNQTREMAETIKQLREETRKVGETSTNLDRQTGELYQALRQGDSKTARENALARILAEPDALRKAASAKWFFSAFEYQLYSGVGLDTPELRERAVTAAAQEFMWVVNSFVRPGQTVPDPLAKANASSLNRALQFANLVYNGDFERAVTTDYLDENNRQASFNALAATLHELNPKQEERLRKDPRLRQISMLSIIEESLRAGAEIRSLGRTLEQYPGYVREVLQFEQLAQLLLQARYNVLGASVLANLTTIRETESSFISLYTSKWPMDVGPWNLAKRELNSKYLRWALQTHDLMREVGIEPKMDERLQKVLYNANKAAVMHQRQDALRASDVAPDSLAMAEFQFLSLFESYRYSGVRFVPGVVARPRRPAPRTWVDDIQDLPDASRLPLRKYPKIKKLGPEN